MLLLTLLFGIFASISAINQTQIALVETLQQQLNDLPATRTFSENLNKTLQLLQVPQFFRHSDTADFDYKKTHQLEDTILCKTCYTLAAFLVAERRANISLDVIALEAEATCTLLGIETGAVCSGVIELNLPIFVYLVDNNPDLTSNRICDVILQKYGCNATLVDWTVDIPEGQTGERKSLSNPESTFNILHISDFHYDPRYVQGKTKACSEPLCCQDDQADGSVEDGTACGYWAEFRNVDSTEALVDESIRKAQEFEFDYVYYTGDIISHRVWSTSNENNTRDLKLIFRKMKSAFKGIPIYPVIGNHEPSPLNEFPVDNNVDYNLSTDWLYRLIISEFSQFLPKSAKRDLMKGGYYSVSPRDGFRVIVLNNNVAQTMNWWLIENEVDPTGQLAWLAQTLKEAEDNGEIVHILSHVPSGKADLMAIWSREYHKIVQRFANTIGAHFNGHTHKDQFMIYHNDSNPTEAISVSVNGASVICDKSNPSFKILNIDHDSFDVVDYEEWTFNLTEANLIGAGPQDWYKLYSFRDHYEVNSLAPSEFTNLILRMVTIEHSLLEDYNYFRYRYSDYSIASACDDSCKKSVLCEIVTSQVGDSTQCDLFSQLYDATV